MSAAPPPTAAAATSLVIAPALFLLVPLFTFALTVLALSHRPQLGNSHGDARPQARAAYGFIAALAVLSTLAGALPLTMSHTETLQQAEAVVQASLYFLLGVPVLHLASTYSAHRHRLLGTLHIGLLAAALSGATLLALLAPFLPSSSTPQYLPPALFLVYSALALPRIALTLFRFLHPSSSASSTSSSSSPSFFLRSRARPRRPITIHVETHRTSIPLSLPSPASSAASFPLSDTRHDREADRSRDQPIELEIALPKRKDSRSRLNEDQDRYLYQDQDEKHQPERQKAAQDNENENEKHHQSKHEKNFSVDTSASTITAVDHANAIARYHRSLSPPLISLTTPPRAAYTSAVTPPPFSTAYPRVEEHLYRFPTEQGLGVGSNESNEGAGHNTHGSHNDENRSLRLQLLKSRSRSLLVFLCAAQLTLLVGYACALGADLSSGSSISISTSTPNSGSAGASLRIVQAACTVLAVTGTMSAYLLHAYNAHLSNSRQNQHQHQRNQRTPAQQIIDLSRANSEAPHHLSSMAYNTPASASAYPRSAYGTATPTPGLGPVQTIDISAANASANGIAKPVIIQLAPPPPPRMRRKRALGMSGPGSNDGSHSSSSPTRSNEEQRASMSYVAHDVSYTYPYSHSAQEHSQQSHQQYQYQQQHQPYAPPPIPKREPIVLTYVPPKKYGETQSSLLEVTEPEGDADANGQDLYLEDLEMDEEMDMAMEDMDGDLNLGDEMAKALSRSSSMATTMSGLSVGGRTRRRTSMRKSKSMQAVAPKPKPKTKKAAEDPATYIRKRGSVPVASRPKKLFGWEFAWDPLPSGAAGEAKEREREREREMREVETQESSFMDLRGATTTVTSITSTTRTATSMRKLKRYSTPAGPMATAMHKSQLSRDAAQLEKLEDIFGLASVDSAASVVGGGAKKLRKRSKSTLRPAAADSTVPASQPFFPTQLPHSAGLPLPVAASPPASGSGSGSGSAGPSPGSFNLGRGGFAIGHRAKKSSSSSDKTSRPGTAESKISYISQGTHGGSKVSLGSASSMRRGGLQLKKSFKMGVGRTLGPGLTLASAGVGGGVGYGREERVEKVRAWEKKMEEEEEASRHSDERDGGASLYAPTMDDDDVDGEIRSIAAARLVSASIARVTPAATILTAPSTGVTTPPPSAFPAKFQTSPVNTTYPTLISSSNAKSNAGTRPTLPAIITSPIPIPVPNSPAKSVQYPFSAPGLPTAKSYLSPTSTKAHTSGSTWKPHPFADPAESPARAARASAGASAYGTASSSPEDDVVQLEREMEEIRSRGKGVDGQDALDSPSAQFKELAAYAGVPISASASSASAVSIPAPSISASMSPSVTSMFALAQAQAQTVAPPPPLPTTQSSTSEKAKGKVFGGGHQKRMTLSSPPAPTSNWGPQQSPVGNGGSSTGGFPYKFPMIFPHSFTGVSPPRSSPNMNQQPQQSSSTPGTPTKGGPTLRLSAMTMGTVRSAFAGVGARMSSATMRMSVNGAGSTRGAGFGEMIMENGDGDFMDLRDPFASPPPASKITTTPVAKKTDSTTRTGDDVLVNDAASGQGGVSVGVTAGGAGAAGARRRMSAWGKLPMPVRSFSPVPSAGSGNGTVTAGSKKNLNVAARAVRIVGKPSAHRKHKRRSKKSTALPSMTTALGAMNMKEDADFGIEEALLSQRLLSRLDTDGWESRA